ncbi:MAG: hemolysin III family protein [Calditrichaceae bacterium]
MINKFKDPVSGLTHFIGAILAIVGMIMLLMKSVNPAKVWHLVSFSVFGSGMILLYTSSTLYHWLRLSEKGTQRLRKLDHIMIFILIAATYTPVCLIPLRGGWGWGLFGSVWGLALAGVFFKLFWLQAPRWLSTMLYVLMGWLVIVGIWPLVKSLQTGALIWLFAGGLFYSVGALIYGKKKPDPWPDVFGFHEIFHVFVMLGSFSHFWVMYRYITQFN